MKDWGPAQYVEAYVHGASIKEIAMITGKAYSTIHHHLRKAEVKFRPRNHRENNEDA